jgi:hypothetical protein
MRMCKNLVTSGFCRQGDQCQFAHTTQELHPNSPELRSERESARERSRSPRRPG